MDKILLWFLHLMTLYAFIPGILSRMFGYRVFKKGHARQEIALTFDDGPDEIYTDQLLDLLKEYNAKATFFLVGSHAKENQDVVRRMKEEGHTIGIHNYYHKMNWFMLPKTVKKQIELTNETIFEITGEYTHYYRPPWGVVNLFDFARVKEFNIVLWSSIFGDWQKSLGVEKLKQKMLKQLKPGAVFLLHDCGKTLGADADAPANMLLALRDILEIGTQKGYTFVTIEQLQQVSTKNKIQQPTLLKRNVVKLWLTYEKLVHKVLRLKSVKGYKNEFFHYRFIKHTGQTLVLNDGGEIKKGDLVVELHFDNEQLSAIAFQSKSMLSTALRLIKETERNLPFLAHEIKHSTRYKDVKGIVGITMINRGADRLGFEVFDLKQGWFTKMTQVYLKILMNALTPSNTKDKTSDKAKDKVKSRGEALKQEMQPRIVALSRYTIENWSEQYNHATAAAEVATTKEET